MAIKLDKTKNYFVRHAGRLYKATFPRDKDGNIPGRTLATVYFSVEGKKCTKKVKFASLVIKENKKAVENLALVERMEKVKEVHTDIFRKVMKRFNRSGEKFGTVRIEWGRRTYRKGGHYNPQKNLIVINKPYSPPKGNQLTKTDKWVNEYIYHELLHVIVPFRRGRHHTGDLYYYEEMYRREEMEKWIPRYKRRIRFLRFLKT